VIVNLAVNARDAMPDGGTLTIATARAELSNEVRGDRTLRPGRYVVLTVGDTGEGMDEATLAHVFEPFFTTKAQGKGVGLGLATVYAVVTQSGGQITVESRPREGTTFTIHLPEAEGEAVREQADDGSRAATGSETILFVEDDELLRPLVRTLLEESGYTALEAADTRDALEIVRTHPAPIHLLLTDVVMPRLSGPQLATACVHERPGIRVLYMSGYPEGEIAEQGILDPGIDYLSKPFTDLELGRKIREVLERPSQTLGSHRRAVVGAEGRDEGSVGSS
jgi:CheY-like chemotaxis protein